MGPSANHPSSASTSTLDESMFRHRSTHTTAYCSIPPPPPLQPAAAPTRVRVFGSLPSIYSISWGRTQVRGVPSFAFLRARSNTLFCKVSTVLVLTHSDSHPPFTQRTPACLGTPCRLKCLRNNFSIHLANLVDFGLLQPASITTLIESFDALKQ
jgi:hypothetical protein